MLAAHTFYQAKLWKRSKKLGFSGFENLLSVVTRKAVSQGDNADNTRSKVGCFCKQNCFFSIAFINNQANGVR